MEPARTKSESGTESWAAGAGDDEVGVYVFPPDPADGRSRCDEVCAWRGHGHTEAALSCTLREWTDWAETGKHVRAIVRDTLGYEAYDQVDAAVRAMLPKPKSYRVGWDTIQPDPGEVGSWDCRVCGDACDVRRDVVGRRSSIGPHESPHDHFTCPNAGEPWHDQALRIRMAAVDMPAPSVRAMMDADADRLVEKRG